MARGIISTILGGVAGGLEGRRVASIREREEMEREQEREARRREREQDRQDRLAEEERRRLEREADFGVRAALSGATTGARLRTDEAAVAEQRLRDTPISRVMDQAPLFEQPSEAPVGRSALDAALQARVPAPDFAAERRGIPQFTPMTEDEEYLQITSPGGQVFSMMTPEARARREQEATKSAFQEENMMAYRTLANIYPGVGEYDSEVDYGFVLDRQFGLERVREGRPPVRPEAPEPTPRDRFMGWIQDQLQGKYNPELGIFEVPTDDQIVTLAERIAPAFGVGAREAVGILQDIGMMPMEPPPPPGDGAGTAGDLFSLPRAIGRVERREQRREADAAEEAGVELGLIRDLAAYERYLIQNPNDVDIRAARESTYRQLSEINPDRFPPRELSREDYREGLTGFGSLRP